LADDTTVCQRSSCETDQAAITRCGSIENQLRSFETQPVFALVVAILTTLHVQRHQNLSCSYEICSDIRKYVKLLHPNNRD